MSGRSLTREFLGHVRAGRPVALATRIDGHTGVGAGLLVGRGGILGGTLGESETDRRAAAFAGRCISEGRPGILPLPAGRIFIDVPLPAPRLVIVGSEDKVAPSVEIQRVLDHCRGPVRFREIVGADHTMRGYENQVAAVVTEFLKSNL